MQMNLPSTGGSPSYSSLVTPSSQAAKVTLRPRSFKSAKVSISPAKKIAKPVDQQQPRLLYLVPIADLVVIADLSGAIKKLLEIAKAFKMIKNGSQYVYKAADQLEVELCQIVTGKVYEIRVKHPSGIVGDATYSKIVKILQ